MRSIKIMNTRERMRFSNRKAVLWFLENGYDKEGEARAWLNENTDRLLSQSAIDDDTSFSMEQSGMDEVAETNRQFEQELIDDPQATASTDRINQVL